MLIKLKRSRRFLSLFKGDSNLSKDKIRNYCEICGRPFLCSHFCNIPHPYAIPCYCSLCRKSSIDMSEVPECEIELYNQWKQKV